jgi:hypothetical protein
MKMTTDIRLAPHRSSGQVSEFVSSMQDQVFLQLIAVCQLFVDSQRVRAEIGDSNAKCLGLSLNNTDGLLLFYRELRDSMGLFTCTPGFDSSLYWCLIDSISFYTDTFPGTWHYVNDNDRNRLLTWSVELATLVCSEISVSPRSSSVH